MAYFETKNIGYGCPLYYLPVEPFILTLTGAAKNFGKKSHHKLQGFSLFIHDN